MEKRRGAGKLWRHKKGGGEEYCEEEKKTGIRELINDLHSLNKREKLVVVQFCPKES